MPEMSFRSLAYGLCGPVLLAALLIVSFLSGCRRNPDPRLLAADSIMERYPDSALILAQHLQWDILPVGYSSSGKMQVLGIFKDGYLPQVQMDCSNDNLTECNKKFIVRTAKIGLTNGKSVFIGSNAKVDIKAIDEIMKGLGLSIEEDGDLTLRCDKTIELAESEVNSVGALHLAAEKVVLSDGFSVKAGGTLSIRGN